MCFRLNQNVVDGFGMSGFMRKVVGKQKITINKVIEKNHGVECVSLCILQRDSFEYV